jgi:uncharacterized lipoprotein YmbA
MNLNLIAAIGSIALVFAAYAVGRYDGKVVCTGNAAVSYQEGVKRNDGIEKQVQRMDVPALDRALSRWVR